MTRCLVSALSPGEAVHLIIDPSQSLGFLGAQRKCHLRCAVGLLWGADLWLQPSWQMSTVQDPRKIWLATGNLLAVWYWMLSLGPSLPLSLWLWLSTTGLPTSSGVWATLLQASSLLLFAQSFSLLPWWLSW